MYNLTVHTLRHLLTALFNTNQSIEILLICMIKVQLFVYMM